jgi:hypothetical protein
MVAVVRGSRSTGSSPSQPSSTLSSAHSGRISATGVSRLMLPFSTSCMAAVDVTALVIDAIRNTVSSVIGAGSPRARTPDAPS